VKEINAELLIGRKVCDANGEKVGRIEEFRVTNTEKACLVEGYLVGTSALVDRLSAWTLIRPIDKALRGRAFSVYEIPWEQMDLSDPKHPKLRIPKSELRHSK
jgi:sporulation protein YlmC with PRC-barrel domain